jgi:hypothetical protein
MTCFTPTSSLSDYNPVPHSNATVRSPPASRPSSYSGTLSNKSSILSNFSMSPPRRRAIDPKSDEYRLTEINIPHAQRRATFYLGPSSNSATHNLFLPLYCERAPDFELKVVRPCFFCVVSAPNDVSCLKLSVSCEESHV